jgi:hypothetical protein
MSSQNINNYYFNRFKVKINYGNYFDLSLASDERDYNQDVVFSPYLIGEDNGNVLPINIDLNSYSSNQKLNISWDEYFSGNTVVSKNYYNPNNEDLSCFSAETLCDIGLTATDNGLYSEMSGQSLTFTMGLNEFETFNPHYYDRRFKLHQVTSYANSPNIRFSGNPEVVYNVISKTDQNIGYYNELYGGFFQGFYKLHGYDYEVFPERVNLGWSAEFLLKPRQIEEYTLDPNKYYLNDLYPNNAGTFFFFGARSENKYYHYADGQNSGDTGYTRVTSGLTCIETCACANTGVTNSNCLSIYPLSSTTANNNISQCNSYTTDKPNPPVNPELDIYSNGLSIRFSGDPVNPKICVKYIKFTGDCVTTGSCETTGTTYQSGYTINEICSTKSIYDDCNYQPNNITQERWVMVSVVFQRYTELENCDLINYGGLGDIRQQLYPSELNGASYNIIMPPQTHPTSTNKEKLQDLINLNNKWIRERDKRLGDLIIYINGYQFMIIENFEEIIPRELNTQKEKQLGVPFNISWGGGTQGLKESLIFSGCSSPFGPYIQDPELMTENTLSGTSLSGLNTNILMEETFGGTFMGGISQFRMYVKPLSAPEVQHNYMVLKEKFDLFDYWCYSCYAIIPPTLTPSISITPSVTPSVTVTPSNTITPTLTPSISITPSTTPPSTEFSEFTFTSGEISGRTGPSLSQLLSSYDTTTYPWLTDTNQFDMITNGIQLWTVPTTGTYRVTARGAQGAPTEATAGGRGAIMIGEFALTAGEKLQIMVGQTASIGDERLYRSSAGGGGSFVVKYTGLVNDDNDILVIAGGGGGTGSSPIDPECDAQIGTTGGRARSNNFNAGGAGGTNGSGGLLGNASSNGAGGGFLTDGTVSNNASGLSFLNGGLGGGINSTYAPTGGGFGGGGAPNNGDLNRFSGGGGYSGGGASNTLGSSAQSNAGGGGGASYNSGANQSNLGGVSGNYGNGSVTIELLSP